MFAEITVFILIPICRCENCWKQFVAISSTYAHSILL